MRAQDLSGRRHLSFDLDTPPAAQQRIALCRLPESAVHACAQDLSGRPHLSFDLDIPTQRIGNYDTQLVEHFFQSVVNTSGMTLHVRQLAGQNSHHIVEATFKVGTLLLSSQLI